MCFKITITTITKTKGNPKISIIYVYTLIIFIHSLGNTISPKRPWISLRKLFHYNYYDSDGFYVLLAKGVTKEFVETIVEKNPTEEIL